MSYLPIFLEVGGRNCVVIGGGAIAERKVRTLIEADASVTVISPEITTWLAAMVRGLDALEFLERSRELAAESVVGSGQRVLTRTSPIDESRGGTHHRGSENLSDPGSGPAMR